MEAASNSDCSSSDEWADLTKSDYAKVIFSQLSWNRESGTLECTFSLTESVTKNPSDYIGLFKVGFENVSQCLVSKTLDKMETENTKLIYCCFKSEELPELNGFYQFCYITHDQEVCGASTPIEVKHAVDEISSSNEDVFTEGVEGDFLMVRSGLEKKNLELLAAVEKYHEDKLVLMAKIQELVNEKEDTIKQIDTLQQKINSGHLLKKENAAMKLELDICQREHINLSAELLSLKDQLEAKELKLKTALDEKSKLVSKLKATKIDRDSLAIALKTAEKEMGKICCEKVNWAILTDERDHLATSLDFAIKENKKIATKLESVTKAKENFVSELNTVTNERNDLNVRIKNMKSEIETLEIVLSCTRQKDMDNLLATEPSVHADLFDDSSQISIYEAPCHAEGELENIKLENKRLNKECDAYNKKLMCAEEKLRKAIYERDIYSKELQNLSVFLPESAKLNAKEEELNDAKLMIKALEDSKLLVMDEMRDLMQKLYKAKDELNRAKCENIALKIQIEEDKKISPKRDYGELSKKFSDPEKAAIIIGKKILENPSWEELDEETRQEFLDPDNTRKINICRNPELKIPVFPHGTKSLSVVTRTGTSNLKDQLAKCKDDNLAMLREIKVLEQTVANLEEKLKIESLNKKKAEDVEAKLEKCENDNIESKKKIEDLNQMVATLKEQLNKEAAVKKNAVLELKKYISNLDENDFDKSVEYILTELQKYSLVKVLKCSLEDEMKLLKQEHNKALEDLNDKTARLLNATEVYKNLYVEKAVLAKKLKKVMKGKSLTAKPAVSVKLVDSQSGSSAISREESISNNSDSDTGERVRSPILAPYQVSKTELGEVILLETEKNLFSKSDLSTIGAKIALAAINHNLSAQVEIPLNIKKSESKVFEEMKKDDGYVKCTMCSMTFTDSPLSNTPMLKHYETEHNMDMCPLCGVLFDKTLPRQYLQFHVDNHFLTN